MLPLLRHCLSLLMLLVCLPAQAQGPSPPPIPGSTGPMRRPVPSARPNPNVSAPTNGLVPQVVPTPPTLGPGQTTGEALAGTIPAPAQPAVWSRQSHAIASCDSAPEIDGTLDDPCWRTATHTCGFYKYGGGTPSAQQTEAWICADKTHLYFAFHCLDSHPELIQSSMTQRNAYPSHDDFVAMDIDSQGSRRGYSTFLVTARGTQFEQLEGGTADNITWAGDWKAATRRMKDGWTCEFSIPFALMRYPRGVKSFGMLLYRQIGRETTLQSWPYMPPAGVSGDNEPQFLDTFTGITPPFFVPRPIFLPYTLATGGTGNAARAGVDIKYPLSTTLTGVATLFPDFQTIEQDVTTINFSYTEKLLTDRRPFFAEGSSFLPAQDLFYSRRIDTVDGGLKVVGKQNNTTLGVLTTGSRGENGQTAAVLNVQQDIGLYSHVLLDVVDDQQSGLPSNQTGKLEGLYGWQSGQTRYAFLADHLPSWESGLRRDAKDFFQVGSTVVYGRPKFTVSYEDTGANFISNLGYIPEVDRKGTQVKLSQYNQFDRGWLENYTVGVAASTYQHHTGGFFHNGLSTFVNVQTRKAFMYELDYDVGRRNEFASGTGFLDQFHDSVLTPILGWNQKSLYQQGTISDAFGRQGGQAYNFLSVSQGILVSHPFSLQLNYNHLALGDIHSTQAIATGTYRLNDYQTIGGRLVHQAGADQGTGLGTDIYFSFSQQVRTGTDVFLLFGDPNSAKTRGKITLKLVHPF